MISRAALVDYDAGNLLSVARAIRHLGIEADLADTPGAVATADRLVLPGVGAFASCMDGLAKRGLVDAVRRYAESARPFLGICVGMQMLFDGSDEFGSNPGLGLIPGWVRAIPARDPDGRTRKIPHVGWNGLKPANGGAGWTDGLLAGVSPGDNVYFVHSFAAAPEKDSDRLAECDYEGARIVAAVRRGNLWGVQFHPEKSGSSGLRILENFLRS